MNVLLISANTATAPYPVYPLGLDYVAGALIPEHRVSILDLNELPEGRLEDAVRDVAPDIIGISIRNIDNTDAANPVGFMAEYRRLVERIRRARNVPTVLGGSGFTLFPREGMEILEADYGIVGEGERLSLLLKALAEGTDPGLLPGIVTRRGSGPDPGPWESRPTRHFDPKQPHLSFYLKHGGMLNLQTKRGCPFRCIYCTYPHIEGRAMRLFPPEEIARTAAGLQEAGARFLFITDSTFNAEAAHSLAVAREFRKAGVSIPWGAFFAPTRLPDGYFETLAACGLTHVEFGTESLSGRVLAAYRKPFDPGDARLAHAAAVAANLRVAHYFLFGGPGETPDTIEETLSRIDRLEKSVSFLFCGMRIYPHTPLHALALREGRLDPSRDLTQPTFYASPSIDLREIVDRIDARKGGKASWIVGAGGEKAAGRLRRMYQRGRSGPLWEHLIS